MFTKNDISKLSEFRIGHSTNTELGTGCTAILCPKGAVAAVDVRGGAPATRETDLLTPENMVEKIHSVVLSGGSAFGLEAANGVMDALSQNNIGIAFSNSCVPIVCAASLFDLETGSFAYPDKEMGKQAAMQALQNSNAKTESGNIGAGCAASVGKLLGATQAMKSGLGKACVSLGDLHVGAVVAVNALGNVYDTDGTLIAGCRNFEGAIIDPYDALQIAATQMQNAASSATTNTTIGCIMTNAKLTKSQASKTASTTHDAYARSIKPVHTMNDGDAIFVMASNDIDCVHDIVTIMATEAMQLAIIDAIKSAASAYGLVAYSEVNQK